MEIKELNPLGWIDDSEIAELLGYPLEAVQGWMADSKDVAQKCESNKWRMEARLFLRYRDVYALEISEHGRHERGRPRTKPEKTGKQERKQQVRKAQKSSKKLNARIAQDFPEKTPQEVAFMAMGCDLLRAALSPLYSEQEIDKFIEKTVTSLMRRAWRS